MQICVVVRARAQHQTFLCVFCVIYITDTCDASLIVERFDKRDNRCKTRELATLNNSILDEIAKNYVRAVVI